MQFESQVYRILFVFLVFSFIIISLAFTFQPDWAYQLLKKTPKHIDGMFGGTAQFHFGFTLVNSGL